MEQTALILIDIQNVYFTEGKYYLCQSEEAVKNASKILKKWRETGRTVIHIKHNFHLAQNEEFLNQIHTLVKPEKDEIVISKDYPNAFLETGLLKTLEERNIHEAVIVGMMTNMCVDTTVRACQNYGLKVTLVHDACAAHDITFEGEKIDAKVVQKVFMGAMEGIFANVVNARDIC